MERWSYAAVVWRGVCFLCKVRDMRHRSALMICSTVFNFETGKIFISGVRNEKTDQF